MSITKLDDFKLYKLSESIAMDIFWVSKSFPSEEKYSLTDQIRRSSRSISANIAEGWGLRHYKGLFVKHMHQANGSLEETKCWIRFASNCQYIDENARDKLNRKLDEVGAKLFLVLKRWRF